MARKGLLPLYSDDDGYDEIVALLNSLTGKRLQKRLEEGPVKIGEFIVESTAGGMQMTGHGFSYNVREGLDGKCVIRWDDGPWCKGKGDDSKDKDKVQFKESSKDKGSSGDKVFLYWLKLCMDGRILEKVFEDRDK